MNVAIILAGGTGTRLGGDLPKQYIEVEGKPIIAYSLQVLENSEHIDEIRVVAEDKWQDLVRRVAGEKLKGFSAPGENRQLSIWNALCDIASEHGEDTRNMVVLIHDAARPFVTLELIEECILGCEEYSGVMPALPVKDTVYYGCDGKIQSLLDRDRVIAGQAPEAFRFEEYYAANKALIPDKIMQIRGSTEPALLAGMRVKYIPGDERNFKITTQPDLERFKELLARK